MNHPANKTAIDALTEARNWFESQHKAISKGCGSTWDMLQCAEQRDLLVAAIAALAPTVQDAEPAQGMPIPTWQERMGPNYRDGGMDLPEEVAMKAEIADLRANIAQRAAVAEVASGPVVRMTDVRHLEMRDTGLVSVTILNSPSRVGFHPGQVLTVRHNASGLLDCTIHAAPTASTPPARTVTHMADFGPVDSSGQTDMTGTLQTALWHAQSTLQPCAQTVCHYPKCTCARGGVCLPPPAPAEKGRAHNLTFGVDDGGKPVLNNAAASPLMQVAPSDARCAKLGGFCLCNNHERVKCNAAPVPPAVAPEQSAPSEPAPQGTLRDLLTIVHDDKLERGDRLQRISSRINAMLAAAPAPAATSGGEAVAWAFPDGLERLVRVRDGYLDSPLLTVNATPANGFIVPLYLTPQSLPAASDASVRAALEMAAQIAENYGPSRPIVDRFPTLRVRGRWEGEQDASGGIASAIRALISKGAGNGN